MKRISVALLLMLLGSTAHAGGYSFSFDGHFIHVEASRHCRSLSCISWSDSRTRRSRRDDEEASAPAPARPACAPVAPTPAPAPVKAQVAPAPVTPVVQPAPMQAPVKPTRVAPAPATIELAAATVPEKSIDPPDWTKDWSPPKDASAPKPAKAVAYEDDSPLGDWQTEGKKGLVRIEQCGAALCGYLLNETTGTTGETVLSNMRAKTGRQWTGDIYSRASGNSYFARMSFRQPDMLRVEACAIGRFACSGNDWTRVPRSDEVVTSRDLPAAPKS